MDRTGSRARVSGAPLISKALAGCDDAGFDTFEPGVRYATWSTTLVRQAA